MKRLMSMRESTGGDKFWERRIALAFRWEAMALSQLVDFEVACFSTVTSPYRDTSLQLLGTSWTAHQQGGDSGKQEIFQPPQSVPSGNAQ
jgi:hypothetical protein